jgi:RNA polymerase sigma-70 factor (ECF subfamily)
MSASAQRARDEWIALRCQAGEPDAYADLIREMERPLLCFARKLVGDEHKAMDVLQEVWLRACRDLRRLQDPGSVRAWLYRLTRGLAIDLIRKESAQERREKAHAEPEAFTDEDPSFDEEDAAALYRALDTLDVAHREVVMLHFLEDLSLLEIAGILGCPEGTVKSRLHHAKKALAAKLRAERP